jgi:hypothetical protein
VLKRGLDRCCDDLSKKAHFQCCWCGVLSRRLLTCHLHGESSCFLRWFSAVGMGLRPTNAPPMWNSRPANPPPRPGTPLPGLRLFGRNYPCIPHPTQANRRGAARGQTNRSCNQQQKSSTAKPALREMAEMLENILAEAGDLIKAAARNSQPRPAPPSATTRTKHPAERSEPKVPPTRLFSPSKSDTNLNRRNTSLRGHEDLHCPRIIMFPCAGLLPSATGALPRLALCKSTSLERRHK